MKSKENQIYLDKIDEIGEKIYKLYNRSTRKDLVMVYDMQANKIYSYVYKEYLNSLNARSKTILEKQYKEANELGKIVLFIKDDLRKKFKSFTI